MPAHFPEVAVQRRTTIAHIVASGVVSGGLWLALWLLLPPIPGMGEPFARVMFGLGCVAVAMLLVFVPGVEAVAHERLVSPAIDPLADYETRRMRINARYLQNTLEQSLPFAAGLLLLCYYARDGGAMRAAAAVTAVWILTRWAFWIGYHKSPLLRGWGAAGMLQSMIVLGYVVYRFGESYGGPLLGLAPLILFGAIEAWLFVATARPPAPRDEASSASDAAVSSAS